MSARAADGVVGLTRSLLAPSRRWATLTLTIAAISAFDMSRAANGEITATFHVSTTTALLVAFLWLPGLIRLLAVAGGAVKTSLGEASSPGLLAAVRLMNPESQQQVVPSLVAGLRVSQQGLSPADASEARSLRAALEQQLAGSLPNGVTAARELLDAQARAYERIRQEQPASAERTFQMERVMAAARAAARRAQLTTRVIADRFRTGRDGDRVTALAALQVTPAREVFPLVVDALTAPRSQFEQYHALVAAHTLLDQLGPDERVRLRAKLEELVQTTGPARIEPSSDRWVLATELLELLRA